MKSGLLIVTIITGKIQLFGCCTQGLKGIIVVALAILSTMQLAVITIRKLMHESLISEALKLTVGLPVEIEKKVQRQSIKKKSLNTQALAYMVPCCSKFCLLHVVSCGVTIKFQFASSYNHEVTDTMINEISILLKSNTYRQW